MFTVICSVIVLMFIGYQLFSMFTRDLPTEYNQYYFYDFNDPVQVQPFNQGLDIAFGI